MDRDELIRYHDKICGEARELMRAKNHDYAGENASSPWMNFERSELMGLCKTEQAFMVRILDKISRLITFIDAGQLAVKGEGVHDSIVDIVNYMVLFSAFCKEKEGKTAAQGQAGFLTEEDLDDLGADTPC